MTASVHQTEDLLFSILVQLILMIGCARLMNTALRRFGQPGVIGEIIAGLLLGPSLVGHFFPQFSHAVTCRPSPVGRGDLREPLVSGGTLPLRQPAREIISRERQSALTIRLRANGERRVPQPARRPEPTIEQPPLRPIGIGANAVASGDAAHNKILTLKHFVTSLCGPQRKTQHAPQGPLRVTPRVELRTMAQAGGVVPIAGEFRC